MIAYKASFRSGTAGRSRSGIRIQKTSGSELIVGGGRTTWTVVGDRRMAEFLSYALVPLAVVAVAVVLLLGLVNLMRGGSPQTSQKLMRLRVLMQFIAIVVILVTIWVLKR